MVARMSIPVVFEKGVFRPAVPVHLPDGARLRVVLEPATGAKPEDLPPLSQVFAKFRALGLVDSGGGRPTRDELHERD
jgi:predicted DNA-binding antitoxin AbrB/MazE fold protein